jgi:hypothetical protein
VQSFNAGLLHPSNVATAGINVVAAAMNTVLNVFAELLRSAGK